MYRRTQGAVNGGPRTSVKSQRKVNHATKKGAHSKPQKENVGAQRNLIGVSGTSLSNRFSTLQKQALSEHPVPQKKGVVVNVKKSLAHGKKQAPPQKQAVKQKQQQAMKKVVESNRTKRQQAVNNRRQGLAQSAPPASKLNVKKANFQKQKPVARKGQAGSNKNTKEKKAPVTNDDLDVEMDAYWHEAGKGPDPKAAQLDRQMEQYWADKPKQETDSAAA
ncbi:hypothetical protein P43SY_009803 [Pythium insidiosum]|uniref:Chromatin target of PRMT1 protein C-terminal domain-containing protein n=1 Tax=Pythium insidiosum TaxID=114742 RepID=A0AAD5LB87_PYTIN|nr:hypothetical protein P43SY_009803 [Pythium insidiosum]